MRKCLLAIVIVALTIVFLGCDQGLYDLPQGYDTTIILSNLEERVFVKDYSINNGLINFSDYYTNYYSAAPRNHYFVHHSENITTSIFTIFPHELKY